MQKYSGLRFHESVKSALGRFKTIVRFSAVGCINTAADFLVFTMLYSFAGLDKLVCQTAGYLAGVVNSFLLNKLWTFGDRGGGYEAVGQAYRFAAVNAASLLVSLSGLRLFTESFGIDVYVSKVLVTAAAQAVNYTGYKIWVFGIKRGRRAIP